MDLRDKFTLRTAYIIALIVIASKLIFICVFTKEVQENCTPTTVLLDGDKEADIFKVSIIYCWWLSSF
jgi:hypothetical protein